MVVATIILILALELGVVGWPASSLRQFLRPSESELWDFLMAALVASGLLTIVMYLATGGGYSVVCRLATWLGVHGPRLSTGNALLDGAVYFVLADFISYWNHRAYHTRWLWWAHKFHHSPDKMNPLMGYRFSPYNIVFDPIARSLPLFFLGASVPAVIAVNLATSVWGAFIHSRIGWKLGWAGRWLVTTPHLHAIHHSKAPEHRDLNFAILLIWDHLFGTYHQELASP